jgi:hypothetical protein
VKEAIMTMSGLRISIGLFTALAMCLLSITPALAEPKLTPGSKRYCSCTCATRDAVLFYPSWEKRYACNLADNKKCTRESTHETGTLHSCMECEKTPTGGLFCVNTALGRTPQLQAPPGKLEQIVPRGIEGTQEIAPPPLESDEKAK